MEVSDSDDDAPRKPKVFRKAEEMDGDDVPKAQKAKIYKAIVDVAEDEEEEGDADVDVDMDDDVTSGAAPSAATNSIKKWKLLAQQKT